jgi:hypothetical protein
MPFDSHDETLVGIARKAISWAFAFLLIGAGGDYIASQFGLEKELLFLNDILSALFVAVLVITYERRRRKRIRERLEVIELMNHHVRNALQIISLSPHAHQREENLGLIREAIGRIEWALREILPGGVHEQLQEKEKLRIAADSHARTSHT